MKIDYAIVGFLFFVGKITIYEANIAEAVALFAIAGLCGFRHWLAQRKIKDKNVEFENAVKEEFEKANLELKSLRDAVGALKLGSAYVPFRPQNGQLKK